jgi:hypothetical protein
LIVHRTIYVLSRSVDRWAYPTTKPGPNAHAAGRNEEPMLKNFEEIQKFGQDQMDTTMKQFGSVSKGWQAIATECADYSKKSFEESTAALEKLFGAKSLDKAIEIQSEYAKSAYEGFVAQATKMGELYTDLAKETYKPFEGILAKATAK